MQCVQTSFEWIQDIIFQYKSLYIRNLKSPLTISQIKKRGHVINKDLAKVSLFHTFLSLFTDLRKKIVIKCWTLETGTCRTEHMIKVCLLKLWPHLEMFLITNASHHRHEIVWISSKYYIRNTIKGSRSPAMCRPVCLAMNGLRYMESPTEYVHELCHYAKVNLSSTYCQECPYSINLERWFRTLW